MTAAADFITFDTVCKSFGTNKVLNDLSFSVGSGERVTLIGPSGSGKTTILRILMTLLKPDTGTVSVGGTWYRRAPGRARAPARLRSAQLRPRSGRRRARPSRR